METWTHEYVKVNKIKLHYVRQGEGPLVILLHGFPEFWYSWRYQIPALAEKHTVVALDMRGYNLSDKPVGINKYNFHTVAADVKEVILKLGFTKATIVGHDWGGGIAWVFAREYPGYVHRLVVLNCPPPQILLWNLTKNWQQFKKSWYMFFFQLPWLPEWYMGRDLKKFFTVAFRGWAHNKGAFTDEVIDKYVEAFSGPYALSGPINYYRASARQMFQAKNRVLKTSFIDTLVIWGEDDKALGKELSENLERYLHGYYKIHYIPNCSHWVQNDAPELVNQYILDFLALEL